MNKQAKHFVVLTSTNLSCNPRCLKEVKLLLNKKIDVTVVAFKLNNWTDEKEVKLQKELNGISFHYLQTSNLSFFERLFITALHISSRFIAHFFPYSLWLQSLCVSKRSWQLSKWVKKNGKKFDFIIAHNPPAFYPAFRLYKTKNIGFAIDVEDYHPGEKNSLAEKKSVSILMKQILPAAYYCSFASPLIMEYSQKLLGAKFENKFIQINNTFSQNEFFISSTEDTGGDKIKIVWFSQYIDYARGLEKIFILLDKIADKITLTLRGSYRQDFYDKELKGRSFIKIKPPVSQTELHKDLANYDIGLAVEDKMDNLNRDICLTNKIWSYFEAGLFVIATDTTAQMQFIHDHPQHGACISFDDKEVLNTVLDIFSKIEHIRNNRRQRYQNAKQFSWEVENKKLLKYWEKV